jgi:hypothetical protein
MAKAPTTEKPKALDTLTAIVDLVLAQRYPERMPTLVDIARVVSLANRSLRFDSREERLTCENAATLAVAKRLNMIG